MNNRFKFRVWDKRLNRYLGKNDPTQILLENGNLAYLDDEGMKFYEVEFCTGLKDKNGKLIYEGDICIPAKDMADNAGEVYRAESGAYFIKGRMKSGMEYDFGIYWHHYMYEIIGNIQENADLLEVKNDS